MTAVIFKFVHPDGTPVADAPFTVSLRKASFDEKLNDGLILPGDVAGLTDALGLCTLELVPGFGMYYLTMTVVGAAADDNGCVGGLRYRFQVPESSVPVHAEDIIVTTPTWSRPWDEAAIQIIIDAKLATVASAAEAKESATQAGLSEVASEASAVRSEAAAVLAGEKADSATLSAEQAGLSQVAAKASEDATKLSETAAKASEVSAAESAAFAANVITDAQAQVDEATRQAGLSAASAVESGSFRDAAQLAANTAAQHADQTAEDILLSGQNVIDSAANKDATAADVIAVTGLKSDVTALKDQTKVYRDEVMAAAGSMTGSIVDGGYIDLSSGVYPEKPMNSTAWKVTVGGTVPGPDGGTYGVGDTLMYTKVQDVFYKIDNTESVSSVNGQTGVVVLDKEDVGLPLVDNTADMDKPISTAQAAENAARTKTVGTLDTTAGRITKVGDYGENGGPLLAQANSVDADSLTVQGSYMFANGGVHLPEASVYLKHIPHSTAGYAKQLAWGLLTDKQYTRTQVDGVWTSWAAPAAEIAVVDNLTSIDATKALSAKQGKVLKDLIDASGGGGGANISRFTYNISAGQTVISGNDLSGVPLAYTVGVPFFVDMNGFPIWLSNDYTATTGNSITLTTAAELAGEIAITVITAKGVNDTYTKAEIDGKIGHSALPVGMPMAWPLSEATIPGGMLAMSGQTVSRAVWPTLWALYSPQAVTDAVWLADPLQRGKPSSGDGSTTFRLPDFNGKHADGLTPAAAVLRGYGKNSAGTPGLFQLDQLQNITGTWAPYAGTGHIEASAPGPTGAFKLTGETRANVIAAAVGTGAKVIAFDASGSPGARTGTETRGTNVTVIWCVVAATALQNVGTMDVLALANKVTVLEGKVSTLEKQIPACSITFDGTTTPPTILSQEGRYVATSVTKIGVGLYAINFAAPIASAASKIAIAGTPMFRGGSTKIIAADYDNTTTTAVRVVSFAYSGGASTDTDRIPVVIYTNP